MPDKRLFSSILLVAATLLLSTSRGQAETGLIRLDKNIPKNVKAQLISDLEFVKAIPVSRESALHAQVFGPLSGSNYIRWFTDRINQIGYNPKMKDGSVAYFSPEEYRHKMFITRNFVHGNTPLAARISILFHEARHTEPVHDYWNHAICPKNLKDSNGKPTASLSTGMKLAGLAGCERELFGAYGIAAIQLFNWAASCETCSEKVKMDALLFARDSRDRYVRKAHRELLNKDYEDLKVLQGR